MNLRELARKDAEVTIEGGQAGNTLCHLTDPDGNEWDVKMLLSDIGYTVDLDGNRVAGRTCWATYRADRVCVKDKAGNDKVKTPRKGWMLVWTDIEGKTQKMKVSFAEPDKTIGLTRLFLYWKDDTESEASE